MTGYITVPAPFRVVLSGPVVALTTSLTASTEYIFQNNTSCIPARTYAVDSASRPPNTNPLVVIGYDGPTIESFAYVKVWRYSLHAPAIHFSHAVPRTSFLRWAALNS